MYNTLMPLYQQILIGSIFDKSRLFGDIRYWIRVVKTEKKKIYTGKVGQKLVQEVVNPLQLIE